MISEYHINLVLGKLDKVLENQRMILQQLVAGNNKISGSLPETIYKREPEPEVAEESEETVEWPADKPQEDETAEDTAEAPVETENVKEGVEEKPSKCTKEKSKTQLFKEYRATGGQLSWRRWKLAGMPEK
jgi:hypothetical protein